MTGSMHSVLSDAQATVRKLEEHLAALAAYGQLSDRLNQAARRLRSFENEKQWSRVLVEATRDFCDRAALFSLNGGVLQLQATRGVAGSLADIPLASAPAFASAVESKDTIVALRVEGELSRPIAALVGEAKDRRFSLFPIVTRERVAAVLYAACDKGAVDRSALELLATIAALVLDHRTAPGFVTISGSNHKSSAWATLTRADQELHLRAQRFARLHVAQMRLYQSQAVKNGRAERNLYTSLKQDIDAGRESFRNDFLTASPTMVDYLHLEIVRTLANDDGELLGPEYPGPMA